jgi:plasmid stability protein
MIQVRNVPEAIHRRLKVRAAEEGLSVSEYLTQEIRRLLERPSRRELLERLATITREPLSPSPADILRQERDAR